MCDMADDGMEKLYELGETLATSADKSQVRRLREVATSLGSRTAGQTVVTGLSEMATSLCSLAAIKFVAS